MLHHCHAVMLPLQALQLLRWSLDKKRSRKRKRCTFKTLKLRRLFRCLNIRSDPPSLFCVRHQSWFFTDDSRSTSQDRRRTLRIGDVPLCASSWRRAARSVFYYESGGGEVGSLLSAQHQKTCRDLLLAAGGGAGGGVGGWKRGSSPRNEA